MAENLLLSFNVVVPLFLEMLLGFFLRKIGLLDEKTASALNKLIFKCFLSILIFHNIYQTEIEGIADFSYILLALGMLLIIFIILMIVIPLFEKDKSKCGVLIQAAFRSNFVLFGIPVATQLLGEEHTGMVSLLIAFLIPAFNILAVADLEFFRGNSLNIRNVLKGIITNPMLLASIAGILVNISGFRFITSVETTISGVAKIATPLALITLGSEFKISAAKEYWRQLCTGLALRLIVIPGIVVTIVGLMGMRGELFVAFLVAFGSPVSVSSYTMADMMDGDSVLASQLVFYSTGLSILTLFVFIFVTKTLGMF